MHLQNHIEYEIQLLTTLSLPFYSAIFQLVSSYIKSGILYKGERDLEIELCSMALFFQPTYSKTYNMPNSQNRSKDQSNIVKPKRSSPKAAAPNSQEEGNKKQGNTAKPSQGSSGKSPNAGHKNESGGHAKD